MQNEQPSQFDRFTVADFMTRTGVVIGPHATLESAQSHFERHDVNVLPVVDRMRLIGVLTKTDYLRAHSKRARTGVGEEVLAFMTPHPKSFCPNDPLRNVLEEMAVTRHRSFVVVENDRVIGIISRESVIRALREAGLPPTIAEGPDLRT